MSVRQVISSLEKRGIPFRINTEHSSISVETGEKVDIVLSEQSNSIIVSFESDNSSERNKVSNIEDYLDRNFLCSKCRKPLIHRDKNQMIVGNCENGCTKDMPIK